MHIAPEYDTTNPIALRLERRVESFIDRKGGAALDRELLLDARTAIVELLAAITKARNTLEVALRSSISGFTPAEVNDIVKNHTTIKAIDAAVAKAEGRVV